MRLGIVTDIHEAVEPLATALAEFRRLGVDQVVSIGDACDTFSSVGRAADVANMLQDASAVGVWGNHDVGLCHEVSDAMRARVELRVLEYMATMRPQLVVAGCRFSHVEPWLDATSVEDLWYFDGPPDTPEKAARSFTAAPERHLFIGHFTSGLLHRRRGCWNGRVKGQSSSSMSRDTSRSSRRSSAAGPRSSMPATSRSRRSAAGLCKTS